MRYMGNKIKLLDEIENIVNDNIKGNDLIFCDLFSGTGVVSNRFKNRFNIIANDIMEYAYILTSAYVNTKADPRFSKLGFDPFEYFNKSNGIEGFIYKNYSPNGNVERKYFSPENAKKIDLIRTKTEEWYVSGLISETEYHYLLACLLESLSLRANVAGVYGAYLKDWDQRALKPLILEKIKLDDFSKKDNDIYNKDSLDLLNEISGDILYLDPPYSKNDYSTQYHLLETIIKYDKPKITGITGTRPNKVKSTFANRYSAYRDFEKIIAKANFRYIIVSYNNHAVVEIEFLEKLLKKHSSKFVVKEISHQSYTNKKSLKKKQNKEYLFFIEKKDYDLVESPLNYMGSKFSLLDEIYDFANPKKFKTFVDLFAGGFNVGINAKTDTIVYNDYNHFVMQTVKKFCQSDVVTTAKYILNTINKFSLVKKGKENYIKFRNLYNQKPISERKILDLYILIQFGFQQQLRFNSKHEFNNPVGMSSFNINTLIKIFEFNRKAKEKNILFYSQDFTKLEIDINKDTVFYCDPPYYITLGSYNDGKRGFKGWTRDDEIRLYKFLDKINSKGGNFILSNVINHKGKTNTILKKWLNNNNYKYVTKTNRKRNEIIVKNY